jgi:DNA-binding SARP family transcriptional activator
MFQLQLFGGIRIAGPDGPLTGRIAQRRQLGLLAFLALHDRPVTRDRLLSVFWPETDTERARRALSDAVYIIRKALGDEAVRSAGDDLILDGSVVRCDVIEFQRAIEDGRHADAVDLYAGPLLDGFHLGDTVAFEDWLQAEREQRLQACLTAAESLARETEAAGDVGAAVAAWRRAAALEPHNSRIALRLIRALDVSGDRAGAIRFAAAHTALLDEEYGIAPSDEFAAFATTLRRSDAPASAGARMPVLPAPPDRRTSLTTLHAAEPPATPDDPTPAALHQRHPPRRMMAAAAVIVTLAAIIAFVRWSSDRTVAVGALDADVVVVLPFRTAGLHPDLAYLGEGMVDLVAAKLTGEAGGPRALPPGIVLATRGRAANGTDDAALEHDIGVARSLRAATLLHGSLVGGPDDLAIQVSLTDVRTSSESARVSARGTESTLHDLVDRLVAEILSRTADEEEHRLAHLTSASLPALRMFLAARAAHRRGHYGDALRLYGLALDIDSTFALAGLGAIAVSGWVGGSAPIADRGQAVATAHRDRLSERDRVGLFGRLVLERTEALTTRLRIREIEDALRRFPDHARLWYLRGDEYLHLGSVLDPESWPDRARESFERAIQLDVDYAEPVHHLASILAITGDTAALRGLAVRYLDRVPDGPVADYLHWLAHHTIGPPFRMPSFDALHTDETLRWIGIVAQDYNLAVMDGAEAVRLRLQRPGIREELAERRMGALAWALNRGRTDDASAILRTLHDVQPDPGFSHRIAILTALFADGDTATAAAAARTLARDSGSGAVAELNACIRTLWLLHRSPHDVPRPPILSETGTFARDGAPWAVARRLCAVARDALWLDAAGDPERDATIDRFERLIDLGVIRGLVDDGHSEWAHLALARLHEVAGSPAGALAALRRRSVYNGWQPYLATILRDEARLARAAGDTAGARRANDHYRAFRPSPGS